MLNICERCGQYRPDKTIDESGPHAVCPECGHRHPFLRLPLLSFTGASGTGKSTVCRRLVPRLDGAVLLEGDILWRDEFGASKESKQDYRNLWLRVCKNIGQAGRPVVLCASASPGEYEACVEARYFSGIHYLAFTCEPDALRERLRTRPCWRGTVSEEMIEEHVRWNQWFQDHPHEYDVTLLDTTQATEDDTTSATEQWIRDKLLSYGLAVGSRDHTTRSRG